MRGRDETSTLANMRSVGPTGHQAAVSVAVLDSGGTLLMESILETVNPFTKTSPEPMRAGDRCWIPTPSPIWAVILGHLTGSGSPETANKKRMPTRRPSISEHAARQGSLIGGVRSRS